MLIFFLSLKRVNYLSEKTPKVSVLLAVRNEEENILRCLEALEDMDYPKNKIEILIGNDRS